MVSEKGREWLEGLDPKSLLAKQKLREQQQEEAKQRFIADEAKKNYAAAIHNVVDDLKKGFPNPYDYVKRAGTMGSIEENKGITAQLLSDAEEAKVEFARVHDNAEEMQQVTSSLADEAGSERLREATAYLGGVMTACQEGQEKLDGAIDKLTEFLGILNEL